MSNQKPDPTNASGASSETPHSPGEASPTPDPAGTINHFETVIAAGLNKPELSGSVVGAFMSAEVYFLSREEVTGENPNAQPLLLSNAAGAAMVAVFTSLERIPGAYIDQAPYGVKVQGAAIIRSLSKTGVVINPGDELSFQIPADGVAVLQQELLDHGGDGR
ncbi:SseB family protein [Glutamicibacter sp. MNS18]|uniref:SseB family protein n=1 Tax=Glutamicibacter sp. MNS18 TaxID=2989817 RepID=UPI002236754E|nr:SseB family protein [Glutamicibacter sp. MNS18]MCW4463947.1 SseB family protein [Glutamicibacter sp. MNS18]